MRKREQRFVAFEHIVALRPADTVFHILVRAGRDGDGSGGNAVFRPACRSRNGFCTVIVFIGTDDTDGALVDDGVSVVIAEISGIIPLRTDSVHIEIKRSAADGVRPDNGVDGAGLVAAGIKADPILFVRAGVFDLHTLAGAVFGFFDHDLAALFGAGIIRARLINFHGNLRL